MAKKLMFVGDPNDVDGLLELAPKHDWSVALVLTETQAGEQLAEHKPDAIVMNATERPDEAFLLCNRVRTDRDWHDAPILILHPTPARRAIGQHRTWITRADAYIEKPIDSARLFNELAAMMQLPIDRPFARRKAMWLDYVLLALLPGQFCILIYDLYHWFSR
jgi:response regulator RpfG family c-di-GMP phosphodiesterase